MNYNNLLKNSIYSLFSDIKIIDINNDKVYCYINDNSDFKVSETNYKEFTDSINNSVNPGFLVDYFNKISLDNTLDNDVCFYKEKNNNIYEDSCSFIKKIKDNDKNLVLVLKLNKDFVKLDKQSDSFKDKIDFINTNVSDILMKVFNTFNSNDSANKYADNYIKSLLEQLIRMFPEFNKSIENSVISEVNKGRNTLMVIDNDMMSRTTLKKVLSEDYEVIDFDNGLDAVKELELNTTNDRIKTIKNISCILLDLSNPNSFGFNVLDYFKDNNIVSKIPIIVISIKEHKEDKMKMYSYKYVTDILEKPFNFEIIKYRINNLISLYKTTGTLNELVMYRNGDVISIINDYVNAYKYDNEKDINDIKKYINILGNQVSKDYFKYKYISSLLDKISEASELANIGLYAIPRRLLIDGSLDKKIECIKNHTIMGSNLVKRVLEFNNKSELSEYAYNITKYHHENYDGSGYPEGLKEDQIPIYVQIVSICLEYNDLLKKGLDFDSIYNKIIGYENIKYSKEIIDSFKKIKTDFESVNGVLI